MLRSLLASVAVLLTCCASAAPFDTYDRLAFEAHLEGSSDVELRVEHNAGPKNRNNWSQSVPLSEFEGLTRDAFDRGGRVQFRFVRPAGTLACEGLGHDRRVDGNCAMTPNPAFADRLAARGIARPNRDQSFMLTMSGVSLEVLDVLRAEGWATPTLDGLVQLGIFHITGDLVHSLARAGYKGGAIDTLVAFKIHGVTPEAIRDYAALGYKGISRENLLAFRIHNVTPDYVRSMRALGLRGLTPETLIQLRIFDVTPEYVRAFASEKRDLEAGDLIKLRIAGIGPKDLDSGK